MVGLCFGVAGKAELGRLVDGTEWPKLADVQSRIDFTSKRHTIPCLDMIIGLYNQCLKCSYGWIVFWCGRKGRIGQVGRWRQMAKSS